MYESKTVEEWMDETFDAEFNLEAAREYIVTQRGVIRELESRLNPTDGWVGDREGSNVISKGVGHLLVAIWPMPYDNYWILLSHDFGQMKTTVRHYKSLEQAQKVAEEWLTKL